MNIIVVLLRIFIFYIVDFIVFEITNLHNMKHEKSFK